MRDERQHEAYRVTEKDGKWVVEGLDEDWRWCELSKHVSHDSAVARFWHLYDAGIELHKRS
jgi:hypothetical protein